MHHPRDGGRRQLGTNVFSAVSYIVQAVRMENAIRRHYLHTGPGVYRRVDTKKSAKRG